MTPQEQALLNELFDRLAKLESNSRDRDAERLIADGLRQAPHAVYALVQTALVQDEVANQRIEELQAQVGGQEQPRGGSFLDNMRDAVLGKSEPRSSGPSTPSYRPQPGYPPQGPGLATGMSPAFGSGGSFLGTAASTAAGVIGGGLLLNSIRSMFGEHAALGGHERGGLGSSGGRATDSYLVQQDRDQDQDQGQDNNVQAVPDQDQIKIKIKTTAILAATIPTTL